MKWIDEDIKILESLYGKVSVFEICKLLSRDRKSINKKAMKLKLKGNSSLSKKRYNINYNYFSQPNNVNSYWAGFIAADGHILKKENSVKIALSIKDENHLYQFKNDIQFDGPIQRYKEKRIGRGGVQSILNIHGVEQWKKDLYNNFNIPCGQKTDILCYPPLKDLNLIWSYIIGYIDGDGCISFHKNKYIRVEVVGTFNIVSWVKHYFDEITKRYENKIYEHDGLYRYATSGRYAKSIIKHCNGVSVPKMNRKWERV